MIVLVVVIGVVLFGLLGIFVLNLFTFSRLQQKQALHQPTVSILVPARNEEANISITLPLLLNQNYTQYEVILLNDNSTDGTYELASSYAQEYKHLQVIQGQPLPDSWLGKNWASYQLAQMATGDYLIFTDADVRWEPDALNAIITEAQMTNADLLTVWTTQETVTWSERLIVPLMAMVVMAYLPTVLVHHTPFAAFSAAIGQCMVWRREAYAALGGHKVVADVVLEDVALARAVKRHGLRLRMADANQRLSCRMYRSWSEVCEGYAKNIIAGYGNLLGLLLATLFHVCIFIVPWILLLTSYWQWGILFILIGWIIRAGSAWYTHQRIWDAMCGYPFLCW